MRKRQTPRTLLNRVVTVIALNSVALVGSLFTGSAPIIKRISFVVRSSGWNASGTADVQQLATANGIKPMDGAALLRQIAARTPEQQQALLAVPFEGDYWRPTCASCGIKLLERTPTKGGSAFWGCSNSPGCKTKMRMAATPP